MQKTSQIHIPTKPSPIEFRVPSKKNNDRLLELLHISRQGIGAGRYRRIKARKKEAFIMLELIMQGFRVSEWTEGYIWIVSANNRKNTPVGTENFLSNFYTGSRYYMS